MPLYWAGRMNFRAAPTLETYAHTDHGDQNTLLKVTKSNTAQLSHQRNKKFLIQNR
jgi:hypothetical protein